MSSDYPNNAAIMKDVLQLLREIVPLLESVRRSIQESAKHIPNASEQLSKVSKATESATVEILDVIDALSMQFSKAQEHIQKFQQELATLHTNLFNNITAVKAGITDSEALSHIETIEQLLQSYSTEKFFDGLLSLLESSKQQYTSIAMALQVQDITNQQLVGISQIIDTVYQYLSTALNRFDHGVEESSITNLEDPKEIVVDINAQYTKSPERQMTADEIVRQWQQENGK
ncbi:MAG: protein phosphatase CheZ [Bacteroidetes bacterium]|jgi:chemotaxis regulatin CheY-phosphate phosphatase CheZ|nr:protein phosphatase CheZ [Bacteroidota bacterium]HOV98538.1 protein phosphatase CheZ [Bacteroidota bacterium]